jgi:hypothetical protein
VLIARAVERGWRDSWVVDIAVEGRVDGVAVLWRGEEGLECAVQKVEADRVESMDMVWVWFLATDGAGGVGGGSGGVAMSSFSNSDEGMFRGCMLGGGQEAELNGVAV